MDNNNLLTKLFPDQVVRDTIKRVISNSSAPSEAMDTNYSFLAEDKSVVFTSSCQPCFGQLFNNWKANIKKARYMSYLPKYHASCTKETRIRWIELGQEMDILPDDVSAQFLHTNGIIIDMLDSGLTLSELYLKLTFMRWMREAPILVNNIVTLVDEAGRDFWAAAAFCHAYNCSRVDHSLLPFRINCPAGGNAVTIERDLGLVMRLHKVTITPRTVDTRTVAEAVAGGTGFRWNWHSTVVKPEKSFVLKDRLMLLSSELHPLIYSGSVTKAAEMIKTLKLRKSNVQFEE